MQCASQKGAATIWRPPKLSDAVFDCTTRGRRPSEVAPGVACLQAVPAQAPDFDRAPGAAACVVPDNSVGARRARRVAYEADTARYAAAYADDSEPEGLDAETEQADALEAIMSTSCWTISRPSALAALPSPSARHSTGTL